MGGVRGKPSLYKIASCLAEPNPVRQGFLALTFWRCKCDVGCVVAYWLGGKLMRGILKVGKRLILRELFYTIPVWPGECVMADMCMYAAL